ncbi:alpha-L-fucosidase [Microbacterium sp. R86528]|uniref:alpha-L-fucosidase n=1 Tax=Microbacterium sp. R86528 TaxID=3093864 RepID=UPI0037C83B80
MTSPRLGDFDTRAHHDYLETIAQVIESGPYDDTWESLRDVPVPRWYREGKFGIFIHWGVYAVPAHCDASFGEMGGGDWYGRKMYLSWTETHRHHVERYGPVDEYGYEKFIPDLTGEAFDPDEWMRLFRRAGARFVVPVAEHHDGFAMYDCSFSPWRASTMGPKRDVLGELAIAAARQSMSFGASSHRAENWWFFHGGAGIDSDVLAPGPTRSLYGPAASDALQPDEAFLEDWLVRTAEIIDRYRPLLLWFDWWIEQPAFAPYLRRLAAFYYNRAREWGREVAINYKFDAFAPGTAVLDVERGQTEGISERFWQNDTAVSKNSWGFVDGHDYKQSRDLVGDLADVVSKNGALLLNVGPDASGRIPDDEQRILTEVGDWLHANGEAIYGTTPWHVAGEGPTKIIPGTFNDVSRAPYVAQDIRFTTAREDLYAIFLGAEPGEAVTISALALDAPHGQPVERVQAVATTRDVEWRQDHSGLHLSLPRDAGMVPAIRIRLPRDLTAPRIPPVIEGQ